MANLLIGRNDECPFAGGVKRVLVVAAHPDDAEYACGGLILRAVDWGAMVDYVVVTDGQKGADKSVDGSFGQLRREEQVAAANVLGVNEVRFLGLTDGELLPTLELRELLVREIRRSCADLIITHDPLTRRYRQHADHRATGMAAIDAAYPASRLPTYYPHQIADGLKATHVRHALLFASDQPDCLVEMDEGMFERKLEALSRHETQRDSFGGGAANRLRIRATDQVDGTAFTLAEPFKYADLA